MLEMSKNIEMNKAMLMEVLNRYIDLEIEKKKLCGRDCRTYNNIWRKTCFGDCRSYKQSQPLDEKIQI